MQYRLIDLLGSKELDQFIAGIGIGLHEGHDPKHHSAENNADIGGEHLSLAELVERTRERAKARRAASSGAFAEGGGIGKTKRLANRVLKLEKLVIVQSALLSGLLGGEL